MFTRHASLPLLLAVAVSAFGADTVSDGSIYSTAFGATTRVGILNPGGSSAPTTYFGMYYNPTDQCGAIEALSGGVAWRPLALNPVGGAPVGIGLSAPQAKLHVFGQVNNEVARFQGRNDVSNNRSYVSLYNTNPGFWWEFSVQDTSGGATTNGLAFRERSASGNSIERLFIAQGGNVGIGTTNPRAGLQLSRNGYASLGLGDDDANAFYLTKETTDNSFNLWRGAFGSSVNFMKISAAGNVGFGTQNPKASLQIGRSGNASIGLGDDDANAFYLTKETADNSFNLWRGAFGSSANYLKITSAGNVGIGTSNPQSKLAVNGTISAKEVVVTPSGWSDSVFDEPRSLNDLDAVADHIAKHKHLPGIPSAATVASEGIKTGDQFAAQLAQIERLTLHAIDLKHERDRLAAENVELKDRQDRMDADLIALKARLDRLVLAAP